MFTTQAFPCVQLKDDVALGKEHNVSELFPHPFTYKKVWKCDRNTYGLTR